MFTSFFKHKPRTNSTCQYTEFQKQSVKLNMEEKQRETCMFTSFFKHEPRTNSTCQYNEFQKQSVKINMEEKQRETRLPRSLSVSHKVSRNLH